MIIGKSDSKSDIFDILHFCLKNEETVTIPSFIQILKGPCFNSCSNLKTITFSNDTQLRLIGKRSFQQ